MKDNSDAPEAKHGLLLNTHTSSKKKQGCILLSLSEDWVLPAASAKELEEREFVVDSRAGMHMVSKKDLNSAELETMRTSRNFTTLMTANGEVPTREEATLFVKELDLSVTVVLLEETPAVLSLGKLCEEHGYTYHWISGQEPHLTKNGKKIKCKKSNYVPFVVLGHLHPLLHHLHHRIDSVFDVNRKPENPVPERSGSTSGELRIDPLHETTETRNKNKNGESEEVQREKSQELPGWLQESSGDLVDESTSTELWENPEQGSQDTSKSSREFPTEPRAKVEPGSGEHRVFTHLPKDPDFDICLKTKITKVSYRRRAGTVVPSAITADHKFLVKKMNSMCRVVVQDLATQWLESYRVKQNLPRRPKRALWSSWSRQGNHKSFTLTIFWNLASLAKNCPGIIVRQHHTDQKHMGLLKGQFAE